jgi:hypothetical protein
MDVNGTSSIGKSKNYILWMNIHGTQMILIPKEK